MFIQKAKISEDWEKALKCICRIFICNKAWKMFHLFNYLFLFLFYVLCCVMFLTFFLLYICCVLRFDLCYIVFTVKNEQTKQ